MNPVPSCNHKSRSKELLKKELALLSYTESCEVFNIIRNATSKYSENQNGVFINVKHLDETTIHKIWSFIEYLKHNRDHLTKTEPRRHVSPTSMPSKINGGGPPLLIAANSEDPHHFSFQGFLDKLSSSHQKKFVSTEKIQYPVLKTAKFKFEGVQARLFKKCREVNRSLDLIQCNGGEQVAVEIPEEEEETVQEESESIDSEEAESDTEEEDDVDEILI